MKTARKLLLAFCLLFACTLSVFAENNVSEIDISVTVRNDGSAYVVQEWRGSFDEGTENYIPISTDGIGLTAFGVSDENGAYELVDNWDIDASFEEKAEKCGVVETSDGVELCFGITEYGERRYAIEYIIDGFIKSYTDYDGTNFMFVNPGMSTFPTDAHVSITLEDGRQLNEANAAIWGFGFDGSVEFINGAVVAQTSWELYGDECVIVMLRLDKGVIFPSRAEDTSFEEVRQEAFEGSDYGSGDGGSFAVALVFLVVLAAVIAAAVYLIKRKRAIKKFYKEAEYFRDVPNGGKLFLSHYLAQNFDVADDESLIIGALILSMINKGHIIPLTAESVGFFGGVKQSVNLQLVSEPDSETEARLYRVLKSASGEDGVLQERELENYAYANPDSVSNIIDGAKADGEAAFISMGGFSGGAGNCIRDLSDTGRAELSQVMGLKKYLSDFSLIAERGVEETAVWKDYLVYATLFGIAEKVMKQLEKVYPEKIPELESYNRSVIIASSYYRSMYRSAQRAEQAARTSGAGGRTSLGGGGGFSGGGSGGGSR